METNPDASNDTYYDGSVRPIEVQTKNACDGSAANHRLISYDLAERVASVTNPDGTATQISLNPITGPLAQGNGWSANALSASLKTFGPGGDAHDSTHCYLRDHLGTAQMEFPSD